MVKVAETQSDIRFQTPDIQEVPKELETLGFVTAQLLLQRGIKTRDEAERFLNPRLSDLSDPFDLTDMDKAVERIKRAIKQKEKIVIYGDYDVDGITSATILISVLKQIGSSASVYLPERMKEGYGLNKSAIKRLKKEGTNLIITVDNGTTSVAEIDLANSLEMDVIVVDHHHVPDELPKAHALINPKRADGDYGFSELAAVGVTYQLARALIGEEAEQYLDLAVLGTVADVVPLVGENRILTIFGLKALNRTRRTGLQALIDVAGLKGQKLETYHIGFQLGPRINAASRMEHAKIAFELLNTEDSEQAVKLAQELNGLNARRQEITDQILESAKEQAKLCEKEKIIIVGGKDWSIGVAGIVASRLTERFNKPTIVFEYQKDVCKGSARSVDGVHIVELLESISDEIEHFGGHAKAAGLTVDKKKYDTFKAKLFKQAKAEIHPDCLKPSLKVSLLLEPALVTKKLLSEVERFIPFGFGNSTPVFACADVKLFGYEMIGGGGSHLRLTFVNDNNDQLQVMAFDGWQMMFNLKMNGRYDVAFTISVREWHGRKFMQQKLVGLRQSRVNKIN